MPPPYSRLCDITLSPCMISSLHFSPAVTPASGAVLCAQHTLRIRLPLGSSPINQQLISPVRGQGELLWPTLSVWNPQHCLHFPGSFNVFARGIAISTIFVTINNCPIRLDDYIL